MRSRGPEGGGSAAAEAAAAEAEAEADVALVCPMAAAIAAGRASGLSPRAAISQAQNYVHRAILHALDVGKGQPVPDRGILWER